MYYIEELHEDKDMKAYVYKATQQQFPNAVHASAAHNMRLRNNRIKAVSSRHRHQPVYSAGMGHPRYAKSSNLDHSRACVFM
jgi:Tfp pilus assembly protein PilP